MESLKKIILYIFTVTPGRDFRYYAVFIIMMVAALGLAIFIKIYIKKHKKDKAFKHLFKRYTSKLINFDILIGLYLFFRYYSVSYLSSRVLLYSITLYGVYLAHAMIIAYHRKYPLEKKRHELQISEKKHLPKKHKHKKRM